MAERKEIGNVIIYRCNQCPWEQKGKLMFWEALKKFSEHVQQTHMDNSSASLITINNMIHVPQPLGKFRTEGNNLWESITFHEE